LSYQTRFALALVLLLVAVTLRMWHLTKLPAGLNDQEIANINLIEDDIKHGDIRVFYEQNKRGQEGLYHALLALVTLLTNNGLIAYRIVSVWVGMLTVALIYSLGVRLFGHVSGLAASALISVMMWPVLLSRLVLVETLLVPLAAAVLLALARALPVYYRSRRSTSNTVDFAALGVLLGFSFYLHPAALLLTLTAMMFIAFIVLTQRPLSLRQLSYIGFAILMLIIIAMPYLISTIRLPELNANDRIFGHYGSLIASAFESFVGIMLQGDAAALYNLPQRPLVDIVSGFFILLGIIIALRRWREPRYALLIIATIILAPVTVLADNSPNFLAYSVIIPVLVLFFGVGIASFLTNLPGKSQRFGIAAVLILLGFNLIWTSRDLFVRWPALESVYSAYHGDIGRIARHLDRTSHRLPTILCDADWAKPHERHTPRSATEQILLLMNRQNANLRFVDCSRGFVFANAGQQQQVIFPDPAIRGRLPQAIRVWINLGAAVENTPDQMVINLDVEQALADALGVFTTSTPASYAIEALENTSSESNLPIAPPIRFGGNITWLGNSIDETRTYEPGTIVPVTTYWRIEGLIPSDLVLFTHILSDPVTIVANRDTIHANPAQLTERDVYIHIADVPLAPTLIERAYAVSVGAYQASSDDRLPVFGKNGELKGDRIFLYQIEVQGAAETSDDE